MTQYQAPYAAAHAVAVPPLLTDEELADILIVKLDWVRSHADEIPGLQRLGTYYRFHRGPICEWLGSLDCLLEAEHVAALLNVPKTWVYANADQIPGVIRLGRAFPSDSLQSLSCRAGGCQ